MKEKKLFRFNLALIQTVVFISLTPIIWGCGGGGDAATAYNGADAGARGGMGAEAMSAVSDASGSSGEGETATKIGSLPRPPDPNPAVYVINDFSFYSVPDIPRPAKGETITDPLFGARITRLTDSFSETPRMQLKKNPDGTYVIPYVYEPVSGYAQPGYPKHDIENSDGTRLLIQSYSNRLSGWHIYNANPPYELVKSIPERFIGYGSSIDARWDATEPEVLYYQYKKKFWKYNYVTDENVALYDFSADYPPAGGSSYPSCSQTMQEEGNSSSDGRYWAFNIRCYDPAHSPTWYNVAKVVFDKDFSGKDRGRIISTITPDNPLWRDAGFVSMSLSGNYVWTGDQHRIYDRAFTTRRDLACANHADLAINSDGGEVVVCGGEYYVTPYTSLGTWLKMVDIETGEVTPLAPLGTGAYHISGNNDLLPGWVVVSSYSPTYPALPSKWADQSIYMIELKKPAGTPAMDNHAKIWRVAHTHGVRKSYSDDPFAKINRKGTKIFFGSGWGGYYPDTAYDTYQISLPATWKSDLAAR